MKKIIFIGAVILSAALMSACSAPAQAGYGESFYVTLSVRCDTLLDNMHLLDSEKHELVPEDGIIFPGTLIEVWDGDSIFDILQREMRSAGIHMAFRRTPGLDSAYVEAINNLYEFDAGPLSGWMFSLNGYFLGMGASSHILEPGDVVEWLFTLDMGWDLDSFSDGWQY